MPVPLLLLTSVYALLAISGLLYQQAVVASILLLLMVLATIGRQKSAWLLMLLIAAVMSLAGVGLALLLNMSPDDTAPAWLTRLQAWSMLQQMLLISGLLLLAGIQLWVALMPTVRQWFKPKMNFNIIQS
ncbi:hypothetical protein [Shewanella sp. NIFS-20-20]|uniref:hypothetical protein n=1 Tax=Shewanella sp. NIFS-20-20 TaxID=2853806 RepID=UPI001C4803F5|nr:hypothetical protein [Shewanella sp. NIFS-20-20]MBV7314267.1 hypothetical protein [Shewanella sp. NIFS-20-20]